MTARFELGYLESRLDLDYRFLLLLFSVQILLGGAQKALPNIRNKPGSMAPRGLLKSDLSFSSPILSSSVSVYLSFFLWLYFFPSFFLFSPFLLIAPFLLFVLFFFFVASFFLRILYLPPFFLIFCYFQLQNTEHKHQLIPQGCVLTAWLLPFLPNLLRKKEVGSCQNKSCSDFARHLLFFTGN